MHILITARIAGGRLIIIGYGCQESRIIVTESDTLRLCLELTMNKKDSPSKFTFSPISSLFREVGSLFRTSGVSYSTFASLLQSSSISAIRSHRLISSAQFKIAVSLCAAGTQRIVDTCSSEQPTRFQSYSKMLT